MIQTLPDWHKGCFLWKFMQVEFYVSRNFPKLNWIELNFLSHAQEKIRKVPFEMYNKNIKTSASTKESWVLHLFPTGCKIRLHFFFFLKFAPTCKNLQEVEYT